MIDELARVRRTQNKPGACTTSATLIGFVLFLTGVMFVVLGMLDLLVRIESLRTALYFVVGYAMYKLGHAILRHFATFRSQRERRRNQPR
ncbi:hypothetical protein [Alteromonas halophila]|uniref:Uncharacterized protein n=1 Tax=Alteromonas halophila TaxID=516698 RepID=A0A918JN49_9ALTE|nr:hypothetical protein [Alteromonas halophila]GGW90902.1 hypothetical protein GCM10007391_26510 [Alteromonas halophila]